MRECVTNVKGYLTDNFQRY